jgi:hypothetical protein
MSAEESERLLERHFDKNAKRGVVLSAVQLAAHARKLGISFAWNELRQMRHRFKYAAFSSRFRQPLRYMSSSVQKYGVVFLDAAVMMPRHKNVNGGCGGFLAAVESLSQQMFAVGMKDGTTSSWEKAVTVLAETKFHSMRVVVTDRDSAVKSQAFRDSIKERFGISWTHLKNRSKA